MSEASRAAAVAVEVAYAGPEGQELVALTLPAGASVTDAVQASGLVLRLNLFEAALGYAIHGSRAHASTPLRSGDRVELLRPLLVDPKDARRLRALARPVVSGRVQKRRGER